MARETMPPPPSLAQHIIFKIVISTISTAVALMSPFSIETARDMCPRGATNYFCRLDLAARVRVSLFAAVTCFFMPEMFVVVIWTARRVGRIVAAAPQNRRREKQGLRLAGFHEEGRVPAAALVRNSKL